MATPAVLTHIDLTAHPDASDLLTLTLDPIVLAVNDAREHLALPEEAKDANTLTWIDAAQDKQSLGHRLLPSEQSAPAETLVHAAHNGGADAIDDVQAHEPEPYLSSFSDPGHYAYTDAPSHADRYVSSPLASFRISPHPPLPLVPSSSLRAMARQN